MSENPGQINRVVVIRLESEPPDRAAAMEKAFLECFSWLAKSLAAGEIKPPATLRLIDSNGRCFYEGLIRDLGRKELAASFGGWLDVDNLDLEKIDRLPWFAVMEDSQGKKLTVRMELDCQTTF